jgi:hypothetical protein
MSAFYDQASLVVVPSGYKSGKIYAQKPLTTDGQLTFTRASTATRINASGLIEEVASGVPRLDYFGSSCPKILLEPQRSNTITHSQDINSCFGSKVGVTVTSDATASPDGTANADLLKFDTTSGYVLRGQTVAAATTYTASVFVKNNNFTTGQILLLNMSDGVIGGLTANINVAAKTATYSAAAGAYTNLSGKVEDYGNGWFRVSVTGTSVNGGNGWYEFAAPSVTNSCYIWGFSLEIGSYVTSYVKTEAAAVTRLADGAGTGDIFGKTFSLSSDFGLYWEGVINGTLVYPCFYSGGNYASGADFRSYLVYNGNTFQLFGVNEVLTAQRTIPLSLGTPVKILVKRVGSVIKWYINGTEYANTVGATSTTVKIRSFFGASLGAPNHESIAQALIFETTLSDAQGIELTTL